MIFLDEPVRGADPSSQKYDDVNVVIGAAAAACGCDCGC